MSVLVIWYFLHASVLRNTGSFSFYLCRFILYRGVERFELFYPSSFQFLLFSSKIIAKQSHGRASQKQTSWLMSYLNRLLNDVKFFYLIWKNNFLTHRCFKQFLKYCGWESLTSRKSTSCTKLKQITVFVFVNLWY